MIAPPVDENRLHSVFSLSGGKVYVALVALVRKVDQSGVVVVGSLSPAFLSLPHNKGLIARLPACLSDAQPVTKVLPDNACLCSNKGRGEGVPQPTPIGWI